MKTEEYRIWHALLSVAALLALTAQNASATLWEGLQLGMVQWTQANHVASLTQWALPVLTALAGNIFLASARAWNLRTLWRRVVPAVAFSCVFWWGLTAVIYLQQYHANEMDLSTFTQCLGMVLRAPYNIGFCQMLVSMFLLYPLLRLAVQNDRITLYCLAAIFLVNLLFPMLRLVPVLKTLTLFTNQLNWGYFRTWAFYLLLGAYLSKKTLTWPVRLAVYCAGIVSTGLMGALTSWQTVTETGFCADYIGLNSPFTAMQTAAIFTFFRNLPGCGKVTQASGRLSGLWMCAPVSVLMYTLSARFLPAYDGHLLRTVVQHMGVDTFMTIALIVALAMLPGFRCLVGKYDAEGEKR